MASDATIEHEAVKGEGRAARRRCRVRPHGIRHRGGERALIPFILSAVRMYESGFASAEDIDRGLVLGAAHPQGPLALADLIGLDTTKAVAESLY